MEKNNNKNLLTHIFFKGTKTLSIGDGDYFFHSSPEENPNLMNNLRKLNIFVGANNSGKSRILREIFIQEEFPDINLFKILVEFRKDLKILLDNSRHARGQLPKTTKLESEIEKLENKNFPTLDIQFLNNLNASFAEMMGITSSGVFSANGEPYYVSQVISFLKKFENFTHNFIKKTEYHKLYLPTLRGMRPFGNNDLYLLRTQRDYFPSELKQNQKIFTGYTVYEEIRSKLLGKQSDRDFVRNYENFLSNNFFDDVPVTLVPRSKGDTDEDNDVVYITFNNKEEDERPIYQLGDGIQTIICITYPLFLWLNSIHNSQEKILIACIEEPEQYLHPSMQRKLVEILLDKRFENIQYFITTHSNHFLDLVSETLNTDDISIFNVKKDNGNKYVLPENNLSEVVYDILGAKPSSLLLANKSIWVEGVTDRLYIRQGLKLLLESPDYINCKKPVEYSDYTFIEYGGANLDHYLKDDSDQVDLDINSISNVKNIFLIVDDDGVYSDSSSKKGEKYKRYEQFRAKLKDRFKATDGLEVENYITPDVLRLVFSEKDGKLDNISIHDYLNVKLPLYLKGKGVSKYISSDGVRFKDKKKFAKRVIEKQQSWNNLSNEFQSLIIDIYNFIKK